MLSRRTILGRPVRRRLCAVVALVAYLAAAIGFPVSAAPRTERPPGPDRKPSCCCPVADGGGCCCSSGGAEEPPTCCAGKGAPADRPATDDGPTPGVRWVIGAAALKCQGHGTLWISVGSVLPPELPFVWGTYQPPAGPAPSVEVRPVVCASGPPTPPPRSRPS